MHLKERKKESESRGASHGAPHLEPIFAREVRAKGRIRTETLKGSGKVFTTSVLGELYDE